MIGRGGRHHEHEERRQEAGDVADDAQKRQAREAGPHGVGGVTVAEKIAHQVELVRTVTFTEWATFVVYAETAEEARTAIQAEAERVNSDRSNSVSAGRDDGSFGDWRGEYVEEDPGNPDCFDVLGGEPEEGA